MSKIIKFTITLITSIIFLTACSTTTSNEDSNWNSQPNQESKNQNIELEEKIYCYSRIRQRKHFV